MKRIFFIILATLLISAAAAPTKAQQQLDPKRIDRARERVGALRTRYILEEYIKAYITANKRLHRLASGYPVIEQRYFNQRKNTANTFLDLMKGHRFVWQTTIGSYTELLEMQSLESDTRHIAWLKDSPVLTDNNGAVVSESDFVRNLFAYNQQLFVEDPLLFASAPDLLIQHPDFLDKHPQTKRQLANFLRSDEKMQQKFAQAWKDTPKMYPLFAELVPPPLEVYDDVELAAKQPKRPSLWQRLRGLFAG